MTERLLLKVPEGAAALGMSRSKVYELIATGELPSVRLGKSVRLPLLALQRLIDQQTTQREPAQERDGGERQIKAWKIDRAENGNSRG